MGEQDIEPLEPGLWLHQWQRLAARLIETVEDLERALRHAFHLVQLAPRPLRPIVNCHASEDEFEAFLEAGAMETAMFELIGDRLGFSLGRAAGDEAVVAEILPPGGQMFGASGRSPVEALFQAWLRYLAALEDAADPEIAFSRLDPHKVQSELRRRPSGH